LTTAANGRFDLRTATVGELLDDPAARQIIDELVPEVANNPMIGMARSMPFDVLAGMAGGYVDAGRVNALRSRLESL
jgi:hypothetical protein